jgi:hypothetical protein
MNLVVIIQNEMKSVSQKGVKVTQKEVQAKGVQVEIQQLVNLEIN